MPDLYLAFSLGMQGEPELSYCFFGSISYCNIGISAIIQLRLAKFFVSHVVRDWYLRDASCASGRSFVAACSGEEVFADAAGNDGLKEEISVC